MDTGIHPPPLAAPEGGGETGVGLWRRGGAVRAGQADGVSHPTPLLVRGCSFSLTPLPRAHAATSPGGVECRQEWSVSPGEGGKEGVPAREGGGEG